MKRYYVKSDLDGSFDLVESDTGSLVEWVDVEAKLAELEGYNYEESVAHRKLLQARIAELEEQVEQDGKAIVELHGELEHLHEVRVELEADLATANDVMLTASVRESRIAELEMKNRTILQSDKELRLEHDNRRARIAELEEEVAWWAGEGQVDRPEMVEWRELAETKNRTPKQTARMQEINKMVRIEHEEEPELRKRIAELQAELSTQSHINTNLLNETERLQAELAEWKTKYHDLADGVVARVEKCETEDYVTIQKLQAELVEAKERIEQVTETADATDTANQHLIDSLNESVEKLVAVLAAKDKELAKASLGLEASVLKVAAKDEEIARLRIRLNRIANNHNVAGTEGV